MDRSNNCDRGCAGLLGGDVRRKLAFLSSFGVHVMKRLAALELAGLMASEALDLPLTGENKFLWKEKRERL